MTSIAGSSITVSQVAVARLNPNESVACSNRAGSGSLHATSSASNARFSNSVGIRSSERVCAWPSQPKPITPTPIRRLAALAAAAAVVLGSAVALMPAIPRKAPPSGAADHSQ
jgi:hypothetical protein